MANGGGGRTGWKNALESGYGHGYKMFVEIYFVSELLTNLLLNLSY